MKTKRLASFALACGALSFPLLGVSPASQASAATVPVVYIHIIQYSPAGPDTPVTTAKLNGEWVQLTNTTGRQVTLTRWTLRDKANHIYRFPALALKAHKSVYVHTGTGKNVTGQNGNANFYWGHKPPSSGSYVWNNTGRETATLRNAAGKTVDARAYTGKNVSGAARAVFKP